MRIDWQRGTLWDNEEFANDNTSESAQTRDCQAGHDSNDKEETAPPGMSQW
jgi:hypothetical protein